MKLAIVGSTQLAGNAEAYSIIRVAIALYKPTEIISGGAKGIDSMAKEVGDELGLKVTEHLPAVKNWEDGFKPRNLLIAQDCDMLIRIACKESSTYGSGWTRDRANELGKPTQEFVVSIKEP